MKRTYNINMKYIIKKTSYNINLKRNKTCYFCNISATITKPISAFFFENIERKSWVSQKLS